MLMDWGKRATLRLRLFLQCVSMICFPQLDSACSPERWNGACVLTSTRSCKVMQFLLHFNGQNGPKGQGKRKGRGKGHGWSSFGWCWMCHVPPALPPVEPSWNEPPCKLELHQVDGKQHMHTGYFYTQMHPKHKQPHILSSVAFWPPELTYLRIENISVYSQSVLTMILPHNTARAIDTAAHVSFPAIISFSSPSKDTSCARWLA